ncbi:hypothetical protein ACJX0J_006638, partial [Zea mays]
MKVGGANMIWNVRRRGMLAGETEWACGPAGNMFIFYSNVNFCYFFWTSFLGFTSELLTHLSFCLETILGPICGGKRMMIFSHTMLLSL